MQGNYLAAAARQESIAKDDKNIRHDEESAAIGFMDAAKIYYKAGPSHLNKVVECTVAAADIYTGHGRYGDAIATYEIAVSYVNDDFRTLPYKVYLKALFCTFCHVRIGFVRSRQI